MHIPSGISIINPNSEFGHVFTLYCKGEFKPDHYTVIALDEYSSCARAIMNKPYTESHEVYDYLHEFVETVAGEINRALRTSGHRF
jgi:hypothetical protein